MMGLVQKTQRILVIDDDLMVGKVLDDYLTNEGFQVTKVTLAEEGYASAVNSPPDLVILDINLPDATGFQICGRLREIERLRKVPIIMISGAARFPNQQAIGKSLGANEYILKPFNISDLGDRVHRLLGANGKTEEAPASVAEAMREIDIRPPSSFPSAEPAPVKEEPPAPEPVPPAPAPEPEPTPSAKAPAEPPPAPAPEVPTKHNGNQPARRAEAPIEPPWEPLTPKATEPKPQPLIHPEPVTTMVTPRTIERMDVPALSHRLPPWPLAGCLFVTQVILTIVREWLTRPVAHPLATASFVAAGWGLLLGLLTVAAAAFRVRLDAMEAVEVLGAASVPIVLKSAAGLAGAWAPSMRGLSVLSDAAHAMPGEMFWLRPLDIFEMVAVILFGFALKRQTRASAGKCTAVAVTIAVAWILTNRGFFLPF